VYIHQAGTVVDEMARKAPNQVAMPFSGNVRDPFVTSIPRVVQLPDGERKSRNPHPGSGWGARDTNSMIGFVADNPRRIGHASWSIERSRSYLAGLGLSLFQEYEYP